MPQRELTPFRRFDPKFAVIDDAGAGDNEIVAAVTGKIIQVWAYAIVASAAVNVRFESSAGGDALTGQMQFGAKGEGISLGSSLVPLFETAAGALLNMELSDTVSVDGHLTYVLVDA